MKLGDNMTTVEACNAWVGETCTRKARPPRIGDIPRYTAVDEESPGSVGSKKLTTTSPSRESRFNKTSGELRMLELRLSNHGDVFSSKTSPVQKASKCDEDADERVKDQCAILSGIKSRSKVTSPCDTELTEGSLIEETLTETKIPLVTVINEVKHRQTFDETPTKMSSRERDDDDDDDDERGNLLRICSKPSQEIREVRKDSALYLEEVEGLRDLRESLKLRSPRSLTPRRESSGYASNLGTFDDERRPSDVDLTISSAVRERRRSSTKRITSETFVPSIKTNKNEEIVSIDKISPSNESTQRIKATNPISPDLSNVRETRDDEFDDNLVRKKILDNRIESFSSFDANDSSRDSKNQFNLSAACETGEILSYAEVLAKSNKTSSQLNKSRILSRVKSFDGGDLPISQSASNQVGTSKIILQRKRMIVHQYSTPNFPSMELESISEKPCEKSSPDCNTTTSTRVTIEDTSEFLTSDKNDLIEKKCENDQTIDVLATTSKIFPKSVKVYQLLSTQSEDRGDGVPNLSDRRISLQITRQEDDQQISLSDEKLMEESVKEVLEGGDSKRGVSRKSANDSTGFLHLTPTMAAGSCLIPVRKLSTPSEMGSSQRIPAADGSTGIGIRPIYPYCPYSPYGSPQGSPRTRRRPLRESRRVSIDNRQGALQLNQYKLLDNIGQGSFGIVKLAYNEEDKMHYAMKILSKKKLMKKAGIFGRMAPGRKGLANPLAKVYREIALLKKLDHPNVVKLVEVLDDPDEDNLYLAFELVEKGEVLQLPTDQPLDEETARINFRDIVLGVEYLHYQRIVHRDIKPSNLLVDSEGHVKVADLGVSAELRASGELLSGPAGTPAFAAPETTTPGAQYSGTLCDVWSMGVTLYSLVTGKLPWDGAGSIIGVQAAVRTEPLKFPEKPLLSDSLRDLIKNMLEKEPSARINLTDIKIHPWVTRYGTDLLPTESDNCRLPVTVTDEEVARVVTRVPKLDTLILIKTMLKQHSFQNPFLPKKSSKSVTNEAMPGDVLPVSSTTRITIRDSSSTDVNSTISNSRTEKFHVAGRSNSAPDTFDCHLNDRQVSVESPLPPVTEALIQENDSVKR